MISIVALPEARSVDRSTIYNFDAIPTIYVYITVVFMMKSIPGRGTGFHAWSRRFLEGEIRFLYQPKHRLIFFALAIPSMKMIDEIGNTAGIKPVEGDGKIRNKPSKFPRQHRKNEKIVPFAYEKGRWSRTSFQS